jgi:ankyrin repeat protein
MSSISIQEQRFIDLINSINNINEPLNNGVLPLVVAVKMNYTNAVKLLLEKGADPDLELHEEMSAREIAYNGRNGRFRESYRLIFENAPLRPGTKYSKDALVFVNDNYHNAIPVDTFWDIDDYLGKGRNRKKRKSKRNKTKRRKSQRKRR